jgi:phosphoadenosine phosphosulfate reductase
MESSIKNISQTIRIIAIYVELIEKNICTKACFPERRFVEDAIGVTIKNMLIITGRHTKQDLELYLDYQEIDKLFLLKKYKSEKTIEIIDDWKRVHNDCVLNTSWGKDSIVLLHHLILSKLKMPVVYMKFEDRFNYDCELVRDKFLKIFDINYHEEIFNYNEVRKTGKHWKEIAKKYSPYRITGIRNDEAGKRLLIYKLYGHSSKYSCRPLSLWKIEEIFAYIEQNNLPLCPVYGYLGGGRWDRKYIRTHSLAGSTGTGYGRTEWEKEYYNDKLNRIEHAK